MARVAPTNRPQNRKRRAIVVFCRLCGFLATLWFFAVFVVFWRPCGFLPSLWFFGDLVVFCRLCGFLPSLWFFAVFVVFWRPCGFLATLWFFGELVVFGTRVAHCVSETGKDAKSHAQARRFPSPADPYSRAHLTTHRRRCARRGLFRVFAHTKAFALLLPENAS